MSKSRPMQLDMFGTEAVIGRQRVHCPEHLTACEHCGEVVDHRFVMLHLQLVHTRTGTSRQLTICPACVNTINSHFSLSDRTTD